ncbi:hypothetical protein HPB50_011901 [Hyalomma asiaticum]|uniref:Uncharacterized protein n=1 Tax=Hyalomma asiaticum TaxID=266040 RepID=A0ACB7SEH4_HYAAI|nr:hypothetical protein HPB50_011901 [Hyalomma asiaticum]
MEPPLSLLLLFGFRQVSGVRELFRPSNLYKGETLVNARYVYDVQELEDTISARYNSQVQRISYDAEVQVGLIVRVKQPWLCASPDGIFKAGDKTTLLEIKCPYLRKGNSIIRVHSG